MPLGSFLDGTEAHLNLPIRSQEQVELWDERRKRGLRHFRFRVVVIMKRSRSSFRVREGLFPEAKAVGAPNAATATKVRTNRQNKTPLSQKQSATAHVRCAA